MGGARARTLFKVLVLALLVLAAHGGALGFGFVMDDWPQIVENQRLGKLSLEDAFLKGTMANSALAVRAGDSYRPVFVLWLDALGRLSGSQPLGWHLASLLVHFANTLILWRLARRLMPSAGAMAAAGLFAIHPALAQSVAWVSGATDPLLALWVMAAVLCHLNWRASERLAWLGATAGFTALALLTKETALPLPLLLLGLDRLLGVPWRRSLPLAVLVPMLAAWAALRANALGGGAGEAGLAFTAEGLRRLVDYGFFALESIVFPWPQHYFFLPPPGRLASLALLPAMGIIGCMLFAARLKGALFSAAWVLLFLAPPLSVAFHQVGAFAFRFLYLPMVGVALLAGYSAIRIRAARPELLLPLVGVVGAVGIAGSVAAARDWRDDEAFYSLVVSSAPKAGSGYYGLARHWERKGDLARQEAAYRNGAASVIDDGERLSLLESLGILLAQNGRHPESLQVFQQLAALPAGRLAGLVGTANVHWMMGDPRAALESYDEAVRLSPSDRAIRANRERLLLLSRQGARPLP